MTTTPGQPDRRSADDFVTEERTRSTSTRHAAPTQVGLVVIDTGVASTLLRRRAAHDLTQRLQVACVRSMA